MIQKEKEETNSSRQQDILQNPILARVAIGYAAVTHKPQNLSEINQVLFLVYIKYNEGWAAVQSSMQLLSDSGFFYLVASPSHHVAF